MTKAHGLVVLSYCLALLAAWLTLPFVEAQPVLIQVLIADIVATIVVFAFSLAFRNSSFYDPYWSVIPIAIAGYFVWLSIETGAVVDQIRQLLVCLVVVLWGVRLTANWLYTWRGLDHVDWRYVNLEAMSGIFWWPLSLVGIHLLPTVIVFLGCIPLYHALALGSAPLNVFDGIALMIGLISVWLEFQSDRELHRFRQTRQSRADVLDSGLWSWCRHPNYLGEIGFWVSLYLSGYAAAGASDIWMVSGVIAMVLLFVVVSIPMIENKLSEDKPGYAAYKARTFGLIPLSRLRSLG